MHLFLDQGIKLVKENTNKELVVEEPKDMPTKYKRAIEELWKQERGQEHENNHLVYFIYKKKCFTMFSVLKDKALVMCCYFSYICKLMNSWVQNEDFAK